MLIPSFNDQQMPVLDASIEVNSLRTKLFLKEANQYIAFFRLESATRMVLQEVAIEAYQVATQSQIIFMKFHANACRFERSTTFIDKTLVVTENA